MTQTHLGDAHLNGAKLTGGTLDHTVLNDAYLTRADLTGATLRHVDLTHAAVTKQQRAKAKREIATIGQPGKPRPSHCPP
jgi:uncharacterized protein YjbI with pentapeptide repeats